MTFITKSDSANAQPVNDTALKHAAKTPTRKSADKSARICKTRQSKPQGDGATAISAPPPIIRGKPLSKTDLVLGLLKRPKGATLDQIVEATDWLPHTTRATLTGLKKKGHAIVSEKQEGVRRYHIQSTSID